MEDENKNAAEAPLARRATLKSLGMAVLAVFGATAVGSGAVRAADRHTDAAPMPGHPTDVRPNRALTDEAALQLLKDHGIVNRDVTWAKIERVSREIGGGQVYAGVATWSFIVKGKFIYTDGGAK